MFRNDNANAESNFWISYADLMAGLLFVFILLIGAIVSKSVILKSDLHNKEEKLSSLSQTLKSKEDTLDELDESLKKSKALISEKDKHLSEDERLLALKDARIESDAVKLGENERMLRLKLDEIEKLNKMLLDANARELQLSDKIIIVQALLDKNVDELNKDKKQLDAKDKSLEDYKGKVLVLSTQLSGAQDTVKMKDEKLLALLNAMDEKKTKYDELVANLQAQKAKIKSLTGIKLQVVTALKDALGNKIDIDKKTGSLRLASNILFGIGDAELKPEAKVELKKAFEEYIGTLVNNKEIKPHLDKIIIEGHTDSDGAYIYNLKLSQDRALAVMEYLLTLDFSKTHNIQPLMIASGRAYLDAINKNGVEDKNASRRIEIKFRLKNEDAMNEIEKVLDAK
jgi:chemotaxis protein MotB